MSTTLDRYKPMDLLHNDVADGLSLAIVDTMTGELVSRTGSEDHADTIALALNTQTATVELAENLVRLDGGYARLEAALEQTRARLREMDFGGALATVCAALGVEEE